MLFLYLLGVCVSMYIIWKACDGFETASSYLGRNLSDGVKGATINAIGSSMPEFLTTAIALLLLHDSDGFAFGIATTAGSDIFNSAVIPGLVILFVTFSGIVPFISISKKVAFRDGLFLIGGELLLIAVLGHNKLTWQHGITLVIYYIVYIVFMLTTMSRGDNVDQGDEDESEDDGERKFKLYSLLNLDLEGVIPVKGSFSAIMLLLFSTSVIGLACWLLVNSCHEVGNELGIQVYFVAVILAAAATSVPDTFISIKDAMKGNYEDAVSNALGSNIFDICVCLGLPLMLFCIGTGGTLDVSAANQSAVAELRVFLLGHTILIFLMFILGKGLGRIKGLTMMLLYASFVVFVIGRAFDHNWALQLGSYFQTFLDNVVLPY